MSQESRFWYCDLPLDELIWNAQVREHFGFDADRRVTIHDFYAALHPDAREPTRIAIETAIRDRHSYDVVYRTLSPSGQTKWFLATLAHELRNPLAPL